MANRRTGTETREGVRSRLATFLLVLLPGFMFLGLLAPAAVKVEYKGAEQAAVAQTLRDFPLPAREPMIAITKATQQATAELGSLRDLLTNGTRLLSQSAKQMMRLPKAQNDDGESIVLDDEKPKRDNLVDQLFDSTGADEPDGPLVADLNALWNKSKHGKIPGPLDPHGDRQYDDFPAEVVAVRGLTPVPVAIPEPESAALLLLGLIGMGMRRGRER
jgi:hypothetical protein